MSNVDQLRQRVADANSRRRRLLEPSRRAGFDKHYGIATRKHDAGKGDTDRTDNTLAFDLGYELSYNKELTDDERRELTGMWYDARGVERPSL